MQYRLLKGMFDYRKVVYRKGDIVETNMDLMKKFPNKFQPVFEGGGAAIPEVQETAAPDLQQEQQEAEEQGDDIAETKPQEEVREEDVTHQFKIAVDEDFKVIKKGSNEYLVFDNTDQVFVNEEPVKRNQVKRLITDYLESE